MCRPCERSRGAASAPGALSGICADALLRRVADGAESWVAEAGGAIVSTGRLEPVAGTASAGLWGGATVQEWRRRARV